MFLCSVIIIIGSVEISISAEAALALLHYIGSWRYGKNVYFPLLSRQELVLFGKCRDSVSVIDIVM